MVRQRPREPACHSVPHHTLKAEIGQISVCEGGINQAMIIQEYAQRKPASSCSDNAL